MYQYSFNAWFFYANGLLCSQMNQAYLLLGGNTGDRQQQLTMAVSLLQERCGRVIDRSSYYETAAWGNTRQAPFLNLAVTLQTKLSARDLIEEILHIEALMGRVRKERYEPRVIDIDIIFFNHEVIAEPHLTVPHPEMQRRRFVLEPLNEIIPAYIHPLLFKTVSELLRECPDPLDVKKISA